MVRSNKYWTTTGGQLFDALRREMDDLVGRLQEPEAWSDEVSAFAPRANVAETDNAYEIVLDLPGMRAEEFNIEFHEGRLIVSGERSKDEAVEGKTFHRVERHHGVFRRTFSLGADVDVDGVTASYQNGVLIIAVPKTAQAQPKRIEVSS